MGGCAAAPPGSPAADLTIARQLSPKQKSFLVTWRLAEASRVLVFKRGHFREAYWKAGPGQRLTTRAGYDILESDTSTKEFSITVNDAFVDFKDDFPFMVPYSDGGIVLVTTHFDAAAINCLNPCSSDDVKSANGSMKLKLRLVPAPGESVIVGSEASSGEVDSDAGAMAYFGRRPIQSAGSFRYISDPELPPWILTSAQQTIPRVLDLYGSRFQRPLPQKPVLFIPFLPGTARFSSSHSGTVIGSQVLLALFGDSWSSPVTDTREDLLRFFAHESFHLWNAWLSRDISEGSSQWLHEGSADAFAYLALSDLALLPATSLTQMQTEALNRCALGLTGAPLLASGHAQYDCGASLQLLLHRKLRTQGRDLWQFWSRVFDRTPGAYNRDAFFAIADEMAPDMSSMIRDAVDGRVTGDVQTSPLESYFTRALQSVGITFDLSERRLPRWYGLAASSLALSRALKNDCGEGGSLSVDDKDGIRITGDANCQTVRSDFVVRSMNDQSVITQGTQAYDSVRATCLSSSSFTLQTQADEVLTLTCPQLPARPRYFSLSLPPL